MIRHLLILIIIGVFKIKSTEADEINGYELNGPETTSSESVLAKPVIYEQPEPISKIERAVEPIHSCVTSMYGMRRVARMRKRGAHFHSGVDLKAQSPTPVLAFMQGEVSAVGFNKRCGNYVEIKHSPTLYSHYCHLSSAKVKKGDPVTTSTQIAVSGQSGDARNNPHLHFTIKPHPGFKEGNHMDPNIYLNDLKKCP